MAHVLYLDDEQALVFLVSSALTDGCEDPNWADHARASGVREVIDKPTTIDAMAKAIGGLLGGRSGRDR
jgi:hypothetical protein